MKERFIIPTNFMESGYLFSGAVSIRNAVEAGVLGVLGFLICRMLPLPGGTNAITWYILIIGPFALLGLFGIQGDPLSVFVTGFIKWRRRRKPYFYSNHSQAYTQEAADYIMDSPQLRDMLADALEKVRENMASERMEYIEGETFRFAEDPEQEALKQAQEELQQKREEEIAKAMAEHNRGKSAEAPSPFVKPDKAGAVDAKQISDMLVLDDLE